MQEISSEILRAAGAKAVLTRLDCGLIEVEYHGFFTETALSALRKKIAHAIGGRGGLVFRYEKAILFCDFSPSHESFRQPSAEVVSLAQYDSAMRFSGECAKSGFIRAVLLPDQILMARNWAKRNSLVVPA